MGMPLTFFLGLKNKPGVLLHGVLLLRLELLVTAQGCFKEGPGELSGSPPTSEPADDLGDNAYRNGDETCSKV